MKFAYLIEPPFNFCDASGRVTGSDVELARMALESAGVANVELVEAEFADLLPGLSQGRWQMTTGLFITEERARTVAFSRPIWALGDGLLVQASDVGKVVGLRSLASQDSLRLAVIEGQIQHKTALAAGIPEQRICLFATYEDAATAVESGKVTAYLSVSQAHRGYLGRGTATGLAVLELPRDESPPAQGAFGFALSQVELRAAVDAFLQKYIGTPDHMALLERYDMPQAMVR